jgi:hypothetical protein
MSHNAFEKAMSGGAEYDTCFSGEQGRCNGEDGLGPLSTTGRGSNVSAGSVSGTNVDPLTSRAVASLW